MLKKLIPLILCLCLVLGVSGCKKKNETLDVDKDDDKSSTPSASEPAQEEQDVYAINPLTGIKDISSETAKNRPVAIMVNNISVAQSVQTGLNDADIIYETEVEGGITRLMALYQDFSKVEKVGTIRSARYVYIDLALGHNAIYIHHGADMNYAYPHLKTTDRFEVSEDNGGARLSNGKATEHTLYAFGDKVWQNILNSDRVIENSKKGNWVTFADPDTTVKYETAAENISVKFSASYITKFKYDPATERYARYFGDTERKDYVTGKSVTVKNVFVLNTDMSHYPIEKYRKISLNKGTGYYFTNGTCTEITWSKGDSKNGFTFKTANGSELKVNAGNSWVCIVDKNNSQPVIG